MKLLVLCLLFWSPGVFALRPTNAPKNAEPFIGRNNFWNRRSILTASSASLLLPITNSWAAATIPDQRPRSVDAGGGVDVSIDTRDKILSDPSNLVFPASLEGRWSCQRSVISVEGDFYQAQSAVKALGASATSQTFGPKASSPEQYETHLVKMTADGSSPPYYAVIDRGYEWSSRTGKALDTVQWRTDQPNVLNIPQGNMEIAVVQRSVILPNPDQGIVAGGQELIRITEGPFVRAVLIKQRFRQAADGSGNLEGLEIMKTFRVLDGIAGTEFPTSTTKTQLRLTRIGPLVASTNTNTNEEAVNVKYVSGLYFDGSNWY